MSLAALTDFGLVGDRQAMLAVPLAVTSSPWATVLLFTGLHALSNWARAAEAT